MFKFAIILFLTLVTINLQASIIAVKKKKLTEKQDYDSICCTLGCDESTSDILKNLNESVDPCDNFYEFACGGFPKHNEISDDSLNVNALSLIADQIRNQIKNEMEEPIKENEPRSFVLVKSLYNLCMDTATIEENGIEPINAVLKQLGGFPVIEGSKWKEENFDWKNTVYNIKNEGFPIEGLFPVVVGINTLNSSARIINIGQPQLSINRESFMGGLESNFVKAFYDYVVEVALVLGADKDYALKELRQVIEFKIEVATIMLPQEHSRNISLLTNHMTIQELQDKFKSIPWMEYINNLIKVGNVVVNLDDAVNVEVPKYISDLELLLNRTSQRVLHNCLILDLIISLVSDSTEKLRKLQQKFIQIIQGTKTMPPRWKECVEIVNMLKKSNFWDRTRDSDQKFISLPIATSALYVNKYVPENAKQNAEELVQDMRNTFHEILNDIDWMDKETKAKAIDKALAMTPNVAYSEELLDQNKVEKYYSKLNFSSSIYIKSLTELYRFVDYNLMSKLREMVNKTDWTMFSNFIISANAFYSTNENSILLPVGILQAAAFDTDRPHYMNYGAIGFVIGHELTHGFDDVGKEFDKNGDMIEWWDEETKQVFMQKAQCIIDQYSNYTIPEINMTLNGVYTQGETIADNGGIKIAYLAYEKWVERNGEEPRLPGLNYTQRQIFWISQANLWCSNVRKELLASQILMDPHPPNKFRVIGPLINSEHFSKDFNCPLGSAMNPSKKCHVW